MVMLLTGASGFLGSRFLDLLTPRSEPVLAVDKREPIKKVHHNLPVEYVTIDLMDQMAVKNLLRHRFNSIIHLAAQSQVGSPDAVRINVTTTKNILNAAYSVGLEDHPPKIVMAGSAAEYGDIKSGQAPPDETTKINPLEPYAESKTLCGRLAEDYRKFFEFPITILRFGNFYGPGQEDGRLMPNLVKNSYLGFPITLTQLGVPTRQWLYLDDACDAIYVALSHLETNKGGIFNIANPDELSLRHLAEVVSATMKDQLLTLKVIPAPAKFDFQPGGNGSYRVAMDVTKATKELAWNAQVGIEEGVKRTVISYLGETLRNC
jgi:dTDP-glucose 4,6-dehydratase